MNKSTTPILLSHRIDKSRSPEALLALLCYDVSMNNSINADGISFRLQDDGGLLLTTPTGQYQIQPQGVADLFDLLCAGQGGFLDATPDLPTWARGTIGQTVIGQLQVEEEIPPRSLETYRQEREQR
jgi:hypothetical protein